MKNKNIIKVINEVISEFDFLGNEEYNKEQETIELLNNEDLQKQFICDSLLNINSKIKIIEILDSQIGGNWDEYNFDDADRLTIEYHLKVKYLYDSQKNPIEFGLDFDSDNIGISVDGKRNYGRLGGTPDTDIEPTEDTWFNAFQWNDINVSLYTENGDEIDFIAFKKAPQKIRALFIRAFTENFIVGETLKINTTEMRDSVANTPYC